MMNMKRMLSLILAFVMVLGMFPVPAFATEGEEVPSVDVVLSLSADDCFMVGPGSGAIMAMKDITVPYFDLALYGLEEYYFSSETYGDDGDGLPGSNLEPGTPEFAYGKVTLLHLYIYALEVFYCGIDPDEAGQGYLYNEGLIGTEVFSISGGVGSSFLNQFWGGDCNLNYYVNYEYPLASEGWGATSDQILLRDGDIITLGHFTGWSFYADPYSIFNYITADNVNPVKGEEVMLTLYYAGANLGTTGGTAQNLNTHCLDVYYAPADNIPSENVTDWEYIGTSDENGQLVVDTTALEAGEYIFAVAGQYGESYTDEICSTPGGVRITVEEPAHTHSYEAAVTVPTCTEGGYTTYTCECGDSYVADETAALGHDYVDLICTRCGEVDPDSIPEQDENGVYQISTREQLAWFAAAVNNGENGISAVLTADIDLKSKEWTPIGNDEVPFEGTFDGQGHMVSNLSIAATSSANGTYKGLFGYLSNATVKNLGVSGVIGTSWADSRSTYAGGIAGALDGASVVENCSSSVAITGITYLGGIVGDASNGKGAVIRNCYQTAKVSATKTSGTYKYIGGIVGSHYNSDGAYTTIENCYFCGNVVAYSNGGGISGMEQTSTEHISNSYYLIDTILVGRSAGAKYVNIESMAVSEDNLKASAAILGDSFKASCGSYPVLSWQTAVAHSYEAVVTEPTCTEGGYTTYTCTVCGDTYVADETAALGHTEEIIPSAAPTCTETGLTEGKKCTVCGEITVAQKVVDALGHTEEIIPAVAPTCIETGLTEGKKCTVCGEITVAQEVVDALGHTEEIIPAVAPTCTETGLTEGKKCTVCGEITVAQEVVDALGHTEDVIPAVAPTCTETGLTEGKKCTVCGEITVAQKVVDALGHTEEIIPAVAPTCTETGLTEGKKCSVCGETLVAQEVVDALGHTEEIIPAVAPTCTETGLTEGKKCSVCGEILVAQEVIPATGHAWKGTGCENCDAKRENPFTDVPEDSWFIDSVLWAAEEGITEGATETTFNPTGDLLRAQVVTMLWRHAGSPVVDIANPFTDVKEGEYYYDAVLWAYSEGITAGTSATTFDPTGKTNRAQAITFLWRYLDEPEADTENPFEDVDTNEWYGKAVLWAVANGVTEGMSESLFGIADNCNRAHMVTFLYRALA